MLLALGSLPIDTERVHLAYLKKQRNSMFSWPVKTSVHITIKMGPIYNSELRVAQVVRESLQLIGSKLVLIPQNMIMSRPACSLKGKHT